MFERIRSGAPLDGLTAEQQALFRLAELVAEVAHNAAGPPPYFNHHAGWRIGPLARLAAAGDPGTHARVEAVLGS
ncbi:hypothetical protein DI272_07990 [Streptomyces sp. Act143]|uniref:hypothetical protein n=1 Tax=Streptomyces sp. Act143 TaxID=2200760 RepID=UPI000D672D57|nr:hypothetical protein [Streptomyces sp. Act143]PWI14104.1 hypothetical protein DI272_07990 [Streptomyces sp. Act143]